MGVFHLGLFLLFLIYCSSGAEVVTIDVKAAKGLLDSGYGFLDVRTAEEYKSGQVATDKRFNIPYLLNTREGWVKNPGFVEEVLTVCKKEDHLVVGCRSGARSLSAAADLVAAGFKDVSSMGGGYLAWVQNGFLVKTEKQKKDEL